MKFLNLLGYLTGNNRLHLGMISLNHYLSSIRFSMCETCYFTINYLLVVRTTVLMILVMSLISVLRTV